MATGCRSTRNGGFYKCEECSKAFNRMASYEAHIRMHAQEELDAFDIVFNYAGKMHEPVPNPAPRRRSSSQRSPLQKSPDTRKSPSTQMSSPSSHSVPKTSLVSAMSSPQVGATAGSKPQDMVTSSPQGSTKALEESQSCLNDSGVVSEPVTSDTECESLVMSVPLAICSSEVLRKPVINLAKRDHPAENSLLTISHGGISQVTPAQPQLTPVGVLQRKSPRHQPQEVMSAPSDVKPPDILKEQAMGVDTVSLPGSKQLKKRVLHDDSLKLEKIQLHSVQNSQKARQVKCPDCDKMLCSLKSMKRHYLIHAGIRPYKCVYCNKTFTQSHHLKKHLRCHKVEDEKSVSSHSPEKKPDKEKSVHTCKVCDKQFLQLRQFKNHLTSHDTSRPFQCEKCGIRCKRLAHLKNHMLTHTQDKTYSCHFCTKKFNHGNQMERHMRIHFHEEAYTNAVTGDVMYVCKYCPKVCRTAAGLSKHHTVHMLKKGKKPLDMTPKMEKGEVCRTSLQIAPDSDDSLIVTDTDTDGGMADISEEGATEESMDEVGSEMGISDTESGFSGGENDESDDSTKLMLDTEESSNEEDNDIDCPPSDRVGTDNGKVGAPASMTHVFMPFLDGPGQRKGSKPHKCEWCGRHFSQRSYLLKHYKLHQQVPHQCELCGKVFMSMEYLKRHIRVKHSKN